MGHCLSGYDHGIGHLVLSILSYSVLWRTEGRCRYVDGRYNASCSTEPHQKTHSVQKLTRAKSRLQTIFHVWIVGRGLGKFLAPESLQRHRGFEVGTCQHIFVAQVPKTYYTHAILEPF